MEAQDRIVIIDGNSLINRAYYAIPKPMMTKEGVYTHGIYGFLSMLAKIRADYEPAYIAAAFDRKAPTFRHAEYQDYKAGRRKMPEELAMQIPLLKDVLHAMNIETFEIDGYEADDIIGAVAKAAEEEGLEPLIITGDKDALQLATDKTKVIITRKGVSDFEIYDARAIMEKYGFSPRQFIDYKGLMGDRSDNIPGLPGVGEKTAQKLILEFGDVENLINNAGRVKNEKLRENIEKNAELALMSRRLAEIHTSIPLEINFEACKVKEPNYNLLTEIYRKLEFNRFLKKLRASGNENGADAETDSESGAFSLRARRRRARAPEAVVINSGGAFDAFENAVRESARKGGPVMLKTFGDQNHVGLPIIYGISIMAGETCFYIPVGAERPDPVISKLARIFSEVFPDFAMGGRSEEGARADTQDGGKEKAARFEGFSGHNLQQDFYALLANGYDGPLAAAFDAAVAQYLLDSLRSDYDLKTMMSDCFNEDFEDEETHFAGGEQMDLFIGADEKYASYGAKWCMAAADLTAALSPRLAAENLEQVFREAELPLMEVLASMEKEGFTLDRAALLQVGAGISESLSGITDKIYASAGEEFNINSPQQLGRVLFEKLGLSPSKKTKTGYATGAAVLEKLKSKHEIAGMVMEYRMLSKLRGTYVDGLLPLIHRDGKIHAHFQQTVTATGRISCTEPNLQNIPVRQDLGRTVRRAFVPKNEEYVLAGADYSQIELRILAHLTEDEALMEDFRQSEDIHRRTAARVFGIAEEEVTPLLRGRAKAVNFGIIYGMSAFGLSAELDITRTEAESYISEYFNKHGAVKRFMDESVENCKKNGYVTTILGRRRVIPEITASNFAVRQLGERLAMNTPIQGSAADVIKLAMINVYKALAEQKLKSRLILQVHDELIIETRRDEIETVSRLLKENMEKAVVLKVPLIAEVKVGSNWYELK
ncbi:MAG: DNA polymerase I [Clostridiales Family XIII bacterium]|jgi:DNA polymerase-1|nr:DNA polymerase I [Clostridiales Family XIII bacterium]